MIRGSIDSRIMILSTNNNTIVKTERPKRERDTQCN